MLMSQMEFVRMTGSMNSSRRDPLIGRIDQCLLIWTKLTDSEDRRNLLIELAGVCTDFIRKQPTSRKVPGVRKLIDQISAELTVLGRRLRAAGKLTAAVGQLGRKALDRTALKGAHIAQVGDRYAPEMAAGHFSFLKVNAGSGAHDYYNAWSWWQTQAPHVDFGEYMQKHWLPMLRSRGAAGDANAQAAHDEITTNQVAYLDANARRDYEVEVSSGILQWAKDGTPVDTGGMKTNFTGRAGGWGIFVMSPGNRFYTNSHDVGRFHHSSFLAGGNTQCAGEWGISNGKLIGVTAKSGHYTPDPAHYTRFLFYLHHKRVNLGQVAAHIYGRLVHGDEGRWVNAALLLKNIGTLTVVKSATGQVTGWSNPTTPDNRPLPDVPKPHIPLLVAPADSAGVRSYTCAGGGMIRIIS